MATKFIAIAFCVNVLNLVSSSRHSVNYNGYTLYRVYVDTKEKMDILEAISDEKVDVEVDFWNFPSALDEHAEVLVSPSAKAEFEKDMRSKHIVFEVIYEDIQRAIDEELTPNDQPTAKPRKRILKDGAIFDVSKYNSWEDIESYLKKLPENYPSLVSIRTIGETHEGRDLIVVKIGAGSNERRKPAIWIDSAIHAREWIAPATTLYILDNILYSYQSSHNVRRYLDEIDWYFLPIMNPDGYVYSFTRDRMWRKNRNPNNCTIGQRRCCAGVDLNRNFGYQWGGNGASSNRCSNIYGGPAAFTEPETKAVRDFVLENVNSIKAFLTYHSYAQSWRHPYAYKKNTFPDDVEELRALANHIVQNLRSMHNIRYKIGTGDKIMSGVSRDWAKGIAKIKYVYCVELASRGSGFVAPTRSIIPSGEENWAALTMVAEKIIEKYVNETNTTTTEVAPVTSTRPPEDTRTWPPQTAIVSSSSANPSKLPIIVGEIRSGTSCDDLMSDCAHQYEPSRCVQDLVVRTVCKRYCGACS